MTVAIVLLVVNQMNCMVSALTCPRRRSVLIVRSAWAVAGRMPVPDNADHVAATIAANVRALRTARGLTL
jgi:hypothetical protein